MCKFILQMVPVVVIGFLLGLVAAKTCPMFSKGGHHRQLDMPKDSCCPAVQK